MNVAFSYNVMRSDVSDINFGQFADTEFDLLETIDAIKNTIEDLGHKVIMIEADKNAFKKLETAKDKIDLLFNIAEGLYGDARESQIPIFCEILDIPYTHSSPTTHAIKLNKHFAKILVKETGVNVPKSFLLKKDLEKIPLGFSFPLIVKPNCEGSSKGITNDSVVDSLPKLKKYAKELSDNITGEILVEEYIDGREFTVGLIGTPLRVLPIIEQKFDFLPKNMHKIAGHELKWVYEDNLKDLSLAYRCPAEIDGNLHRQISEFSIKICELLEVKDAARIDYRYSKDNKLYFIEINTLPGINPNPDVISYFPLAARTAGIDFKSLINEIICSACVRYGLS